MTSSNVSPLPSSVNTLGMNPAAEETALVPTAEAALEWLDRHTKKGFFPASSARLMATALREILTALGEGESHDAKIVLDNLDTLLRRHMTIKANNGHPLQPATARSYLSRARKLLVEFLKWYRNPLGYKPPGMTTRRKKSDVPKDDRGKERTTEGMERHLTRPDSATEEVPASQANMSRMRDLPLGGGRRFEYRLPNDEISFAEVKRVALHLLTMASDCDFGEPAQMELLAVIQPQNASAS